MIFFFHRSYIVAWLDVQLKRITEEMTNESDIDNQHFALVSEVMVNIRFPMMDSRQLASLLLSPLVMKYKEFFMERMAIGVAFHQGNYFLSSIFRPV